MERKDSHNSFPEINENPTESKVLLVDDSVFNLIAVEGLFNQFGLDCDTAVDGTEAVKLIRKQIESDLPVYKLIMMDYSMPQMDGPEATRAIRQLLNDRGVAKNE